jgi:hypothetical protein
MNLEISINKAFLIIILPFINFVPIVIPISPKIIFKIKIQSGNINNHSLPEK